MDTDRRESNIKNENPKTTISKPDPETSELVNKGECRLETSDWQIDLFVEIVRHSSTAGTSIPAALLSYCDKLANLEQEITAAMENTPPFNQSKSKVNDSGYA